MEVFDFNKIKAHPYAERDKNILYSEGNFKVRIIKLPPKGNMPQCEMKSSIIFFVIEGSAQVTIDKEQKTVKEGQCLISKPATLSIMTQSGVKIMAVQIEFSPKECD